MSSVRTSKLEQQIVHMTSKDNFNEVLRNWNANGWRAIAISATVSDFGGLNYQWYIIFERYVQ